MGLKYANGARTLLAGSIIGSDAALTVSAGDADKFPVGNTASWLAPGDWFKVTITDDLGNFEIIHVGTRASGSPTFSQVLRGQEGTTARSWAAGCHIQNCLTAKDVADALGGILGQLTISNGAQAAALSIVGGLLTISQAGTDGTLGTARFTLDQTTGTFTAADFAMPSDERLKSDWKPVRKNFVARLADVLNGSYRRQGSKRREVGVGAASLRQVIPEAVKVGPNGMLEVSYGQAAMVAAVQLAQDNVELRAALVDCEARLARLEGRRA